MRRLQPTADTVHFGFYDAVLPPVLEIDSGEEIVIGSVSAHPYDPVPPAWLPEALNDIYERAPRGPGPHILTGPIAVAGARPGDLLEVEILDVRMTQPYGYNIATPLKGMFPDETAALKMTIMPIDLDRSEIEVTPAIRIPARPYFGQLGVAPPPSWGRIDSRPPRAHGGNMDNKELLPGTRLFLPVWVDGANFSVGDGHAAQGDGEINQTAVETSMEGRFRLRIRRDFRASLPFAVSAEQLITMGFHEDLDDAARIAMRTMIGLLEEHYGMSFDDAYRLCSVAADMRVTQFVNGNRGIHVLLSHRILAGLGRGPAFIHT
jgi:acetamidase/formamidase